MTCTSNSVQYSIDERVQTPPSDYTIVLGVRGDSSKPFSIETRNVFLTPNDYSCQQGVTNTNLTINVKTTFTKVADGSLLLKFEVIFIDNQGNKCENIISFNYSTEYDGIFIGNFKIEKGAEGVKIRNLDKNLYLFDITLIAPKLVNFDPNSRYTFVFTRIINAFYVYYQPSGTFQILQTRS